MPNDVRLIPNTNDQPLEAGVNLKPPEENELLRKILDIFGKDLGISPMPMEVLTSNMLSNNTIMTFIRNLRNRAEYPSTIPLYKGDKILLNRYQNESGPLFASHPARGGIFASSNPRTQYDAIYKRNVTGEGGSNLVKNWAKIENPLIDKREGTTSDFSHNIIRHFMGAVEGDKLINSINRDDSVEALLKSQSSNNKDLLNLKNHNAFITNYKQFLILDHIASKIAQKHGIDAYMKTSSPTVFLIGNEKNMASRLTPFVD